MLYPSALSPNTYMLFTPGTTDHREIQELVMCSNPWPPARCRGVRDTETPEFKTERGMIPLPILLDHLFVTFSYSQVWLICPLHNGLGPTQLMTATSKIPNAIATNVITTPSPRLTAVP